MVSVGVGGFEVAGEEVVLLLSIISAEGVPLDTVDAVKPALDHMQNDAQARGYFDAALQTDAVLRATRIAAH